MPFNFLREMVSRYRDEVIEVTLRGCEKPYLVIMLYYRKKVLQTGKGQPRIVAEVGHSKHGMQLNRESLLSTGSGSPAPTR
jgi:hypothetical protein